MRSNFVSLHPYFKVHPGKVETVKRLFPQFVEKTATEKDCLFYGFTSNGSDVFCREAYENAEALLAHVENIGVLLAEMLKSADLTRIEIHGPADALEKLKKPLAHLSPTWFAIETNK